MWKSERNTDDENLKWAWLRAVEWQTWPLFLSQPVIPVLLYFYSWHWVIISLAVVTLLWWLVIPWRVTPATGIDLGVYFVQIKFLTSPLMAFLTWQKDNQWLAAALVLASPFLVTMAAQYSIAIPRGILEPIFPALKAGQIGLIQQRIMRNLGYDRVEGVGYVARARRAGATGG